MFQHINDLQFDARVSAPDTRFGNLLFEQFGGGNGELKAAMQYFVQAFACRRACCDKYDLLWSPMHAECPGRERLSTSTVI